jgi:protein phosphatase
MRAGAIRQLSTDHTWVQEAVESGILSPSQVRGHPNQHVIRRYLGGPTPPEVDLRLRLSADEDDAQAEANQGLRLLTGDMVLLTSDGLTDLVRDEEILAAYQAREGAAQVSPQHAGGRLIDLANERGGHDNSTLVAVSVPARGAETSRARGWLRRNWAWTVGGCAVLLAALVAAVGLAGGWWWTNRAVDAVPTGAATVSAPLPAATQTPAPAETQAPAASPPSAFITPTATPAALFPSDGGPTLTPWPTNTLAP